MNEALVALIARERSVHGVNPVVIHQVLFTCKTFLALKAGEGQFALYTLSHFLHQVGFGLRAAFSGVNPEVVHQVLFGLEVNFAFEAGEEEAGCFLSSFMRQALPRF